MVTTPPVVVQTVYNPSPVLPPVFNPHPVYNPPVVPPVETRPFVYNQFVPDVGSSRDHDNEFEGFDLDG